MTKDLDEIGNETEKSIELRARLYGRGNIMVFLLFCHILLISFNISHHYWRGLHPSNHSYLIVTSPASFFLSYL